MKDMKNIQAERKEIRKQLNEAYWRHDRNEVIKAAKQLCDLAVRIINN